MSSQAHIKKQNDGHLNLYRLMRLQNRENNFIYRDPDVNMQFRVTYQHFPLETINHNDLLKTFWKFITTHHFKKIDQEENYKLNYLQTKFNRCANRIQIPNFAKLPIHCLSAFTRDLNSILQSQYLEQIAENDKLSLHDSLWLKRMLVAWANDISISLKKTKKITKSKLVQVKKGRPAKKGGLAKMKQQEAELNCLLQMFDFKEKELKKENREESDNIDEEIQRLQRQLQNNEQQNKARVAMLEGSLRKEKEWTSQLEQRQASGEDASCIEWLVHILEEKQIAESVTKVVSCERSGGQSKFVIHFENAMNIVPQLVSEQELKRINLLREVSLFKFYKTGVKSIYSYACQNYAGLADMYNNRMNLNKCKDKDYMQSMRKGLHLSPDVRQELDQFDVCHHCKYIYPSYLLTTCKFVSDRQSMPKTSELQPDLHLDTNLQRGRISQRFVSKHRNCYNGYAKINQEYVCGRKFCKSCIKDCYGSEWMKNNNGLCPFCLGICSCTRCLRHEKMNKLKTFFISLGGDLTKLQEESQIQKLPIKKDQVIYKPKTKSKKLNKFKINGMEKEKDLNKTKQIIKQNKRRCYINQSSYTVQKRMPRLKYSQLEKGQKMLQEQTERWSSTAEKELNTNRRTSKRRILTRLY